MKNIIFSILFIPLIGLSQNTTNYKEFNCGIYSGENIYVFPGASFLWGRTTYDTNNLVIDYQFGLALNLYGEKVERSILNGAYL